MTTKNNATKRYLKERKELEAVARAWTDDEDQARKMVDRWFQGNELTA